jgi:hypothetical protein
MAMRIMMLAAAAGLATLAISSPSQAFTFQSADGVESGGYSALQPYTDPDRKEKTNKDGTTSMQFGGGTMTFGGQTNNFDQNFYQGRERMFSPSGILGR